MPNARSPRLPVLKSKEQETVKAILELLRLHRIPAWRINTGAVKIQERFIRFALPGFADIIGVWRPLVEGPWKEPSRSAGGLFLAIEVKSLTGVVSPAQAAFLAQVNAAGGKAFVARTLDDVRTELGLP